MAIDLYHSALSPASRAVLVTAKHLGIDLNIKEVDLMKGEQNSDEFLKLNPCHMVPTIVDGDFVLWESRAIMRYLCNKYSPDSSLYPSDPQIRATVDRLLDFDNTLHVHIHAILANKFKGLETTEQQMDNYHKYLKLANTLIGDRKHLACDDLTIADLSIAHTTSMLGFNEFKDAEDYGNLTAWYSAMKEESNHFKEGCEGAKEAYEKLMAEKLKGE